MRSGVDFIVNGQLALGPLAGSANLLVRTSGYSELGDFLYLPCDTQARSTPNAAFRLAFLADLLHSLQGQLPPQMLLIRGGDDLVSLQTDDYIYHYRAVKQRFMEAMRNFRKHRMPDPAESSHFGRWSDCAHEVLKQRLLRDESRDDGAGDTAADAASEAAAEPLRRAVGSALAGSYDMDIDQPEAGPEQQTLTTAAAAGSTLAEQARQLVPGTFKPGPGYFRLRQLAPAKPIKTSQAEAEDAPVSKEPLQRRVFERSHRAHYCTITPGATAQQAGFRPGAAEPGVYRQQQTDPHYRPGATAGAGAAAGRQHSTLSQPACAAPPAAAGRDGPATGYSRRYHYHHACIV